MPDPDPDRPSSEREQTDESLRAERDATHQALSDEQLAVDDVADAVIVRARERADKLPAAARVMADGMPAGAKHLSSTPRALTQQRELEDLVLREERDDADAILRAERAEHAEALSLGRDDEDGSSNRCRELSERHEDCPENRSCSGIYSSNRESCQPDWGRVSARRTCRRNRPKRSCTSSRRGMSRSDSWRARTIQRARCTPRPRCLSREADSPRSPCLARRGTAPCSSCPADHVGRSDTRARPCMAYHGRSSRRDLVAGPNRCLLHPRLLRP